MLFLSVAHHEYLIHSSDLGQKGTDLDFFPASVKLPSSLIASCRPG